MFDKNEDPFEDLNNSLIFMHKTVSNLLDDFDRQYFPYSSDKKFQELWGTDIPEPWINK